MDYEFDEVQRAEMRAETFAAEAMLGLRPGTTEGWYDNEYPPEPADDPDFGWWGSDEDEDGDQEEQRSLAVLDKERDAR